MITTQMNDIIEKLGGSIPITDNLVSTKLDRIIELLGNGIGSGMSYSTEEKVVGTWVDGKPVYRKVVEYTGTLTDRSWVATGIVIENVKCLIAGQVIRPTTKSVLNTIDVEIENDIIQLKSIGSLASNTFAVIVDYIKTTD